MRDEPDVFSELVRLQKAGVPCALCTVVRTAGSTPRKSAARMLVLPLPPPPDAGAPASGLIGTIGGGRVEKAVLDAARALLKAGDGEPRLLRYHLTHQLAMCCGGEMEIFVEPLVPPPVAVICGGGHVAHALVPLLRPLGFSPILVEDLEELADPARFPDAAQIVDSFDVRDWKGVPLNDRTFAVIVTRDHAQDQALLEQLVDRELAYLGMIGSQRKVLRFRQRLLAKGFSEARLDRVHAPIGVSIEAQTPAEIAIAIAAELIAVRAAQRKAAQPHAKVVELQDGPDEEDADAASAAPAAPAGTSP